MYIQCKSELDEKWTLGYTLQVCEGTQSPTSAMKEVLAERSFPGAMGSDQQHMPTSCKSQLKKNLNTNLKTCTSSC